MHLPVYHRYAKILKVACFVCVCVCVCVCDRERDTDRQTDTEKVHTCVWVCVYH